MMQEYARAAAAAAAASMVLSEERQAEHNESKGSWSTEQGRTKETSSENGLD